MPETDAKPARSPARVLTVWAIRAAVLYAVLMLAWIGIGPAYGAAFRGVSAVMLGNPAANVRARFVSLAAVRDVVDPALQAYADVAIDLRNQTTGARAVRAIDSRFFGFVPTVVFLSLVLTTPLPWRRRGRALAWGLPLVHVLIGVRLLLYLATVLSGPTLAATDPSPAVRFILEATTAVVSESTLASYVLPLLLWAVLVFRSGDWSRLFGEVHSG